MTVSFYGTYKKYSLIQNGDTIQLHNKETGHTKPFMRVYCRRVHTYELNQLKWKENKKIKSYINNKWKEFTKDKSPGMFVGSFEDRDDTYIEDDCVYEFLTFISKGLRAYKLDDLLEE